MSELASLKALVCPASKDVLPPVSGAGEAVGIVTCRVLGLQARRSSWAPERG